MGNQNPPPEARTLAQRLYQGDPLLVWLRDRRQISYSVWVVSLALLSFFLLAFLPRMVGVPLNASSFAVSALQGLIIMPLGFSLYLLIPDFVAGLYDVLHKGGVIGEACQEGDPAYPTFIDNLVADVNRRSWIVMALVLVALYWYYRLNVPIEGDPTRDIPSQYRLWIRLIYLLIYSPLIYGALLTLVRFMLGLLYSHRLFRQFKLQINPLNPDGAGGLSHVGTMLVVSVLVAVLLGAASAGMIIFNISLGLNPFTRAETIALGIIYLVFTPLLFAIWLWAPHQALLEARQEAMLPLATEYLRATEQALPVLEESAEAIKAKTERLVEIKRQYDLVRDTYPVWPLPDQTLKRLVATASLPALSPFLSGLVVRLGEYLLKLFNPQ
jgi:hypothetical protein